MSNLMELLRGLPMEELPEGFKEELHEKLITVTQEKPEDKKAWQPVLHLKKHFKAYSATAAVLVIGMVSLNSLHLGKGVAPMENFVATEAPAVMMDQAAPAPDARMKMQQSATPEAAPVAPQSPESTVFYAGSSEGAALESPSPAPNETSGSVQERKVIRSGSANLNTLSYDKTVDALTAYANQMGGYVENLYTGDQPIPLAQEKAMKTGSITLRIPAGQFDDFFKNLETYGKISMKSLAAEDISNQYRDTYNQTVNLEVREAKLREIMGTAKTVSDVMAVEAELSRVRGEINQLKGTLQQWDALVDLSRVTINITEVRSLETQVSGLDTSLMTRIREAFIASVNGVIAGAENLAIWLVSALPWLVIGSIVLLGLWFPVKKLGWIRRK